MRRWLLLWGLLLCGMGTGQLARAQEVVQVCPSNGIQPRPADFQPSGLILTTFDGLSLWVYHIQQGNRYPLPDTNPCGAHCHPSLDRMWITWLDTVNGNTYTKMRFDGTLRTPLVNGANEVQWWDASTFAVWTVDQRLYLLPEADLTMSPDYLDAQGVISLQPRGYYAVVTKPDGAGGFTRQLEDLRVRGLSGIAGYTPMAIGTDEKYYNNLGWSPNGLTLAYVQKLPLDAITAYPYASELFLTQPDQATAPRQLTQLGAVYGATRINGYTVGDLSWSPDGTQIAFWVIEVLGSGVESNLGQARIHLVDVNTGQTRAYCGYATDEHTPTTPRVVWSPDGTHLAFGGNVPNDNKGYLLLVLNVASGQITEMSDGIYPTYGAPNVISWGLAP